MIINIPCPNCGCQNCEAVTADGEKCRIQICRCPDGSGEFEVSIALANKELQIWEKYQCPATEIASSLTSRYNINYNTISHQCF
jgi:hypothetical protein